MFIYLLYTLQFYLSFILCFRHLLLSCISLGIASTRPELLAVAEKTLMAVQKERLQVDIKRLNDNVIADLFKLGALIDASDNMNKIPLNVTLDINSSVCKEWL